MCIISLLVLMCGTMVNAQTPVHEKPYRALDTIEVKDYYELPVGKDSMTIAGNYGEFRPNHFHGGIDVRTGNRIGAKVKSVADGYISKISIEHDNYGNCLFVTHPNGTTTVYAHLDHFRKDISDYLTAKQYESEHFEQELSLTPEQFPVKRGELIAISGNSGSSEGPHLHFEIRESKSQGMTNIMQYPIYKMVDKTLPIIKYTYFYGISFHNGVPTDTLLQEVTTDRENQVITVPDTFYIAIKSLDYMDYTFNNYQLWQYRVLIDGIQCYSYTMGDVPHGLSRNINSLIQYDQRVEHGRAMLKTYVEPGNVFVNGIDAPTGGLFTLSDDNTHVVTVEVEDYYGNVSKKEYSVKRCPMHITGHGNIDTKAQIKETLYWNKDNYISSGDINLIIKAGTLFDNREITISQNNGEFCIKPCIAFNGGACMMLKHKIHERNLRDKVLIAKINKDKKNYLKAEYKAGYVISQIEQSGTYMVDFDTIEPSIVSSFKDKANVQKRESVYFIIKDDKSGIMDFRIEIDGKWALGIYDQKYNKVTLPLGKFKGTKVEAHKVVVSVTDRCGNKNQKTYTLLY